MQLRRQDVLNGAIAILDEFGLGDLTMRRLASSLHVQPGALYWHFPNKQTLLGAIADDILATVDAPLTALEWDGQLAELAACFRDALLARRDGAELVAATYASRLTTSRIQQHFAAVAVAGGMTVDEADLTAFALLFYVLGQTVDEQSRMQMDSVGALAESSSPLFETPDPTARFEFGLQIFVAGVRHRIGEQISPI